MPIKNETFWTVDINDDDLYIDEFISISIEESVDLSLPICKIKFQTQRWEQVQKYSAPGCKVSVGLGKDSIETSCNMKVFKKDVQSFRGNNNWIVSLWLSYDSMDYYNKHKMEVYNSHSDLQRSSEVVSTVTSAIGFTPEVEQSDDKMLWLQHNISDRRFLEEVVTHGWFGEQKPTMYAARRDGKFIYKPITSLLTPKFSFGQGDDVDIPTEDQSIAKKDGFLTAWLGKERKIPFHSWEKGLDEEEIHTPDQHMSGFVGMDEATKYATIGQLNDNMHINWYKAEGQNLQGRASLSAATTEVILHKEYKDVYALDCFEGLFIKKDTMETILPFMGNWLATKVVHRITDNHYSCTISLSREGLLEGD
jgi:hypothetical protein